MCRTAVRYFTHRYLQVTFDGENVHFVEIICGEEEGEKVG
jgi:hypothetical protein